MNAPSARSGDAIPTDPSVRDLLEAIEIVREARRESSAEASTTPYSILYRTQMHLDSELRDHFTGGRDAARSHNG